MQKKLIAVAVAGALMPAAAMAQSTVQIFGNMYIEYSFAKQGRDTAGVDMANPDVLQAPGSEIGFRGEEKLGGGMSAWFQCTSTADIRGQSPEGFCSRNSAVGLRGSFGNFFIGNWDTPFKRTMGNTGGRDTGIFGTAWMLAGQSTTTQVGASTGVFKRRQTNSINYDSPNFSGFQFMAATTSTNSSTGVTASNAGAKSRIWSLAGQYRGGPLTLAAGYEQHDKLYGANAAAFAGDGKGWHLTASYRLGDVVLGGMLTEQKGEPAAGQNAKVKAYQLGAEWKIQGPHNLHFGYTVADDVKGTAGAVLSNSRAPVNALGETGAKMWQIRYLHDFSKRTVGTIGYVSLKNDTRGMYALGGLSFTTTSVGAKDSAFALSIAHRF